MEILEMRWRCKSFGNQQGFTPHPWACLAGEAGWGPWKLLLRGWHYWVPSCIWMRGVLNRDTVPRKPWVSHALHDSLTACTASLSTKHLQKSTLLQDVLHTASPWQRTSWSGHWPCAQDSQVLMICKWAWLSLINSMSKCILSLGLSWKVTLNMPMVLRCS